MRGKVAAPSHPPPSPTSSSSLPPTFKLPPQPASSPPPPKRLSSAARALEADGLVPLGGGEGDAMLLGVRVETGTVEAVSPTELPSFSYLLPLRARDVHVHWAGSGRMPKSLDRTDAGFHHLGDLSFRLRRAESRDAFKKYSTVANTPPLASTGSPLEFTRRSAAVDASACVRPEGGPLRVRREVSVGGDEATISWTLSNAGTYAVEVGALGFSMPFNQMFTGRSLPSVARHCSFTEAYVGGGAGYIQVTRTTGSGPVLLVLPGSHGFEGWRPLKQEDRANYDWMHEMLYEVLVHSRAYAEDEWRKAQPWNPPSSRTIAAGGSAGYSVRLILAKGVEDVNERLLQAGLPVAVPLPGAALHADMGDARLELIIPPNLRFAGALASPSDGLAISKSTQQLPPAARCAAAAAGSPCSRTLVSLRLTLRTIGRIHIQLTFSREGQVGDTTDSLTQYVQLIVLAPASKLLTRYGDFSLQHGWLPANVSDPWARAPAFMGTDADEGGPLLGEPRVFMAGLSDEAGAAAPLAMAIKQLGSPSPKEVAALEEYVHSTLWPGDTGERRRFVQGSDYSVRASLLYWNDELQAAPAAAQAVSKVVAQMCSKCWPKCYWMHCWSEKRSLEAWRAYNYPHVVAVYWALYRLSRHFDPPLTSRADWRWYLTQAARTALAMWRFGGKGTGTSQWGLMVGSVFALVLVDLRREGLDAMALEMSDVVKRRQAKWLKMEFPYGSEFPWDSTGHEEIHTWLLMEKHFEAANKTAQAVLGYATVVPNWAYCGSARRYWDFVINGKTQWGNEREFHHYGSTLNAIPVLDHYRAYPARTHLLRLGACALLGHLSNIHESGAASMAWHGDPALLRRDGYSGDYGIGLYGYWRSAGSYLTCVPPHGWICFYCELTHQEQKGASAISEGVACDGAAILTAVPRDAFARRLHVGSLGLTVEVEGAAIQEFELHVSEGRLMLTLRAHERSPSTRASLFVYVDRVLPPPPASVDRWHVECVEGSVGCRVSSSEASHSAPGEFVIALSRQGSRLSLTAK